MVLLDWADCDVVNDKISLLSDVNVLVFNREKASLQSSYFNPQVVSTAILGRCQLTTVLVLWKNKKDHHSTQHRDTVQK